MFMALTAQRLPAVYDIGLRGGFTKQETPEWRTKTTLDIPTGGLGIVGRDLNLTTGGIWSCVAVILANRDTVALAHLYSETNLDTVRAIRTKFGELGLSTDFDRAWVASTPSRSTWYVNEVVEAAQELAPEVTEIKLRKSYGFLTVWQRRDVMEIKEILNISALERDVGAQYFLRVR